MRWFKHMTMAGEDESIVSVIDCLGFEGYGRYWRILEIIAAQMRKKETRFTATYSTHFWCQQLRCKRVGLSQLLATCEELRLFQHKIAGNQITIECPKLLKYRDEYQRKSGQTPDIIPSDSQPRIQKTEQTKEEKREHASTTSPIDDFERYVAEHGNDTKRAWDLSYGHVGGAFHLQRIADELRFDILANPEHYQSVVREQTWGRKLRAWMEIDLKKGICHREWEESQKQALA